MPKAPINNERIARRRCIKRGDEVCVIIKLPLGAFEASSEAHEKQSLQASKADKRRLHDERCALNHKLSGRRRAG